MKNSTKLALMITGVLVLIGGVVGITYAFFRAGGVQETANTFTSGCLNISLTNESTSIHLTDAYPITDVEGLKGTSYDFTVKNNCNSSTNYQINLESLNEQVNSLNADYIKVSLSSDTVDNVISTLSSNTSLTPSIDNAYESYNLYTDSLNANEEKTYHLKIWLDYEATVEEAASKVYTSKINVIANPETTLMDTLEAKFSINSTTVTTTLTDNVTSANYCVTKNNICTPNTNATITNNEFTIELEESEEEQVVCTRLNGTSKIICSNGLVATKSAADVILAGKTQLTRNDFSTTVTDTTTGTIYYEDTTDGRTYYFAGNPIDNWVQFAGFWWRIIRINENGSIRMIYAGEVSGNTEPATTGATTQIGTSTYNSSNNNNMYVGYMYQSNQVHGLTADSTIKGVVDQWYEDNLQTSYSQYISTEAGFCGDRTSTTTDGGAPNDTGGTGTTRTYYGARYRLYTNKTPTFECPDEDNDLYTVASASKGNNALDYPIGLIIADEVAYAGGVYGSSNSSYYLYTNQYYWTMSPSYYNSWADAFYVTSTGNLNSNGVHGAYGVRPVINLSPDVTIMGEGTVNSPYQVVGA